MGDEVINLFELGLLQVLLLLHLAVVDLEVVERLVGLALLQLGRTPGDVVSQLLVEPLALPFDHRHGCLHRHLLKAVLAVLVLLPVFVRLVLFKLLSLNAPTLTQSPR